MAIKTYLQNHLAPQLASSGLTDRQIEMVTRDVGRRLSSLLCRWNDLSFRRTVLLIGQEEAAFYQPDTADLDTRSLVVMTIRNSWLEDLASTTKAAHRLGLMDPVLTDRDIPVITGASITYFAQLDLTDVARATAAPDGEDDVFGSLPTRYPVAWRAFSQLAQQPAVAASAYEPIISPPPFLPVGRPLTERWHDVATRPQILSGMESAIEPHIQKILRLVTNGIIPAFFSDSFKMVTRNPDKLCRITEFVLCHGRPVVTHNYYIRNGYVARRAVLLRPAHSSNDVRTKFRRCGGLSNTHGRALWEIAAYL